MISKAKSCPGGTALFNYVVNDKKGYELLRNDLSGSTPKELFSDMMIFQQQNLRCVNNTISIVLSPTVDDGKKLSINQLKTLTQDFLIKMDLDPNSNQFIAFVHDEKEHKHVHILLNRVNKDGSLINDSFISKKAQKAAHDVAKLHQLTSAKDIRDLKENKAKISNSNIKKEINNIHLKVLKMRPQNLKEYQEEMCKAGVQVLPTINKQGNIQGYRFLHETSGINLKASEVDRNLKLNEIFKNEYQSPDKKLNGELSLHDWKFVHEKIASISSFSTSTGSIDEENDLKKKRKLFKR